MGEIEDLTAWFNTNPDPQSDEYQRKRVRFGELYRGQKQPGVWDRVKEWAMPTVPPEGLTLSDPDPYSWGNTGQRVFTNALAGLPDLGIGIYNAGARAVGKPGAQVDYVAPTMRENAGVPELPADASYLRTILEGIGSAAAGGGAGATRAAVARAAPGAASKLGTLATAGIGTTVAPTFGAHHGGEIGASFGERLGDKETGSLIGSLLGGFGSQASWANRQRIINKMRGMASPDAPAIDQAARRQDVTPTAGMLGNEQAKFFERDLGNKPGSTRLTDNARRQAIGEVGAALDRAVEGRGATEVRPTAGTIGEGVVAGAEAARAAADLRSSTGQQQLMDQIGPRTDVDASSVLAQLESIRNRTDPGTFGPIDTRVDHLIDMLPRNAEGDIIGTTVPYERYKDWRTNLRNRTQNYEPVPGRYRGEIYDEATGAMRDAAQGSGVAPHWFDTVQQQTRAIEGRGGLLDQLSPLAEGTPDRAYNFLHRGEQNPDQLRLLDQNLPDWPSTSGNYLRKLGNETLGEPGARGPINFAKRWEGMHPDAQELLAGSQRSALDDVATLARTFDYPTSQPGLGRIMGSVSGDVPRAIVGSEVGADIGRFTGIEGAATLGRLAGLGIGPMYRYWLADVLQSPDVRNAMTGRGTVGYDLPARLNAVGAAIDAAEADRQKRERITVTPGRYGG